MANVRDRERWAAMDKRAESDGFAAWQVAARDGEDLPFQDAFRAAGADSGEVLRALMLFCLPPKTYGDVRRFRSGYYRLIALIWRQAPDLLEGCRSDADVAARLGISRIALVKHIAKVDELLGLPARKNGSTTFASCKKCKSTTCGGSSRDPGPV